MQAYSEETTTNPIHGFLDIRLRWSLAEQYKDKCAIEGSYFNWPLSKYTGVVPKLLLFDCCCNLTF